MIFWQHIINKLQDNQNVYLLTVIENSGSSPGRKGFKMLVSEDGFINGSIGGGIMEYKLSEEAKRLLKQGIPLSFIKKQIHKGKGKDGSGMICSGEQTVSFNYLNNKQLPAVKNMLASLKNGDEGTLILDQNLLSFSNETIRDKFQCNINTNNNWFYKEHIGFKNTIYIIGAGHVGLALSELMSKFDYKIVLLDNRKELNTLETNNFAHKKIAADYNDINKYIPDGTDSYVVIMTNTYIDDKLVLSKLLKNNYKYIGVLGSKFKLETMWTVLKEEGFSKNELAKVNAPIGISIKSETPNEIAVSIAAQIIKIKNS